jgi:multiple sugar transport system substrate-binding protein
VRRALACCVALWGCREAAGGGRVTLELATRADYAEVQVEDRVLGPYLTSHAGLRVVQQSATRNPGSSREHLLASLAGGTVPDVFRLDNGDVPALVNRGAALDLSPYVLRAGIDLGCMNQTVLAMFSRGDAVYALPRGYTPLVVAYNKDLFDRAGIPYPRDDWTWDEFLGTAKRLTRDTQGDGIIDQWAIAFDRRPLLWIPWIWAGGGDVLCSDGRRASGCLDGRATVEALRWYTAWVTTQGIAPGNQGARRALGDDVQALVTGRVAMLTTGHYAVPQLRAAVAAGRLRVGFVAIPHRAGVRAATAIYATAYAVPAAVARRKLAVGLAAYLTDSLADALRAEAGHELPAVATVAQALVARDTLGWEAAFLRVATAGRVPWGARVERWAEVEAALPDLIDRVTLMGTDPARAAREMARELDRVLGATR